jgi:hypothetical protein
MTISKVLLQDVSCKIKKMYIAFLGKSGKADAVECISLVTARGNASCQWNPLQSTEIFIKIEWSN